MPVSRATIAPASATMVSPTLRTRRAPCRSRGAGAVSAHCSSAAAGARPGRIRRGCSITPSAAGELAHRPSPEERREQAGSRWSRHRASRPTRPGGRCRWSCHRRRCPSAPNAPRGGPRPLARTTGLHRRRRAEAAEPGLDVCRARRRRTPKIASAARAVADVEDRRVAAPRAAPAAAARAPCAVNVFTKNDSPPSHAARLRAGRRAPTCGSPRANDMPTIAPLGDNASPAASVTRARLWPGR